MSMRQRTERSEIELTAALERAVDAFAQRSNPRTRIGFAAAVFGLRLEQFVGEIERSHHGDAIESDDFSGVANLAHLAVEEFCGIE